jgi:hypothetical protein
MQIPPRIMLVLVLAMLTATIFVVISSYQAHFSDNALKSDLVPEEVKSEAGKRDITPS